MDIYDIFLEQIINIVKVFLGYNIEIFNSRVLFKAVFNTLLQPRNFR